MNNRMMLIALHETPGIGWLTISRIIQAFPSLIDILQASPNQLYKLGLSASKVEHIYAVHMETIEQRIENNKNKGIQLVTLFDDLYPERLRHIADPPWVLYTKGNTRLLHQPSLAVVGTRNPTVYGNKSARDLSAQMSVNGMTVVSGLARGIDSSAHIGSLKGIGSTIAVLGSGIDQIYPKENASLYHQITESGLIISEYGPGISTKPGMFIIRNRIIAGLTLGTMVVEAGTGSGSLITVNYALKSSRDVYVVPGPISSPKSAEGHKLIQNGAKLVTNGADILEEYKHYFPRSSMQSSVKSTQPYMEELTNDEHVIVQLIGSNQVHIDELLKHSKFEFGHLHSVLLALLIKNKIKQLPGTQYGVI